MRSTDDVEASPDAPPTGDEMDIELIEPTKHSDRPRPRVTANQLPALMQFGRFDILGRIAFGGMAEIFLARETTTLSASRYLAIKRILPHVADDPAFVEMFLDEARLAMQLNHPNICHIYEFGELDGSYFIAMEWIHGAALGKIIRKARPSGLPFEFSARVIAQIAEALHYAHRARDTQGEPLGIVHRDVSPQNIMVSYEGQVKLLDFGIAKAQSHTTKTQAGVVKGKFSYMSPQQCVGQAVDARADVFALGICLYEILTGEGLYRRPSEYETMRAVIEEPVPSARARKAQVPVELDAIVQKALQKDPADRFSSAAEMQGALEDWLQKAGRAMTATRIADQMHQLFEDQILRGPAVEAPSLRVSEASSSLPMTAVPETSTREASSRRWPLAIGLGVALALALGAAFHVAQQPETGVTSESLEATSSPIMHEPPALVPVAAPEPELVPAEPSRGVDLPPVVPVPAATADDTPSMRVRPRVPHEAPATRMAPVALEENPYITH